MSWTMDLLRSQEDMNFLRQIELEIARRLIHTAMVHDGPSLPWVHLHGRRQGSWGSTVYDWSIGATGPIDGIFGVGFRA